MLTENMSPKLKRRVRRRRPEHLDRYWTTSDLKQRYGRSARTLIDWQALRGFPKPLIRGGHGAEHRWLVEDVVAWEEALREETFEGSGQDSEQDSGGAEESEEEGA